MDATFTVNLYDRDGDIVYEGVYVHINNGPIIKFKDSGEMVQFASSLISMTAEINNAGSCSD